MNNIKFLIKKEKIYLFFGLIFFKLTLDFVYIYFVNKIYAYDNFILDFNIVKYAISFLIFIILYLLLPRNNRETSSIILLLHFMIMILPMFTVYAMKDESTDYFFMICICFAIECVLIRKLPNIKIYKTKQSKYIFYILVGCITTIVYIAMIKENGLPSLGALNLLNVYNIRDNVKYPFLMNYLVVWQAKVINPFMIAVSYKNNKKGTLILFIGLQVLIYLITAHKTYILIPIAIILVMHTFRHKNIMSIISILGTLGCLLSHFVYKSGISLYMASLVIRRLMFVPAQLKFYFYDFVSRNEFLYFSEGIIGKIIGTEYPYNMNFVYLIADVYFNEPDMAANTGYLGSGYANLGFTGMLIYVFIFSFILIIIDSIGKKLDKSMVTGIVLFSMLGLNDGDLLTTLLTGGLFFLIILLYLYAGFGFGNDKVN